MATLELITLRCIRKQDVTGRYDEPRIKVDGVPKWDGSVEKGRSAPINKTVRFENQVSVSAEEMNGNSSKPIGDVVVVHESGNPKFLTFKTSGAHYEVDFEVRK